MKINTIIPMSILAVALGMPLAHAETAMTASQKKEVEHLIHDYLVENPEVLVEASQALQKKQQDDMQTKAKSAIAQYGSALVSGTLTVAGNPKGDVTLVEFFDYQCGHCVKMKSVVNELIKKNANLRVIFKEFPIFGKESEMASRVAIVAAIQGKYMPLQSALFNADKRLDEQQIMTIAKEVGLDMNALKKDMNSKKVSDILEESRKLAESIHLMGTPAFVVLSTPNGQYKPGEETSFIPGAASEATLQELINKAVK